MPQDPNEIGALWKRIAKSTGQEYYTGTVNGQQVVVFPNKNKSNDKQPDFRILKSTPRS